MKKNLVFNFILATIGLFLFLSSINLNNFNHLNNYLDKENQNLIENVKSADYTPFIEKNGEDINITLQQSLLDTSIIHISNISDSTNNTFYEPCPKVENFSSSFMNITIDDIYAPNKNWLIEDDYPYTMISCSSTAYYYISFSPKGVGYLENISVMVRETDIAQTTKLSIYFYNSENVSGRPRPYQLINVQAIVEDSEIIGDTFHWHKMTNIHAKYNSSETFENTFFLELLKTGGATSTQIEFNGTLDPFDSSDDMMVLDSSETAVRIAGERVDIALELDFAPLNYTPPPSNISLKINNKPVDNTMGNQGIWISNTKYEDQLGKLNFTLTADWWDVSCRITKVLINYTKSDLKANSNFIVMGSGQDIIWNVSRTGGVNYFDSRLSDYKINFTIPSNWKNINVFNGGLNKTEDISISSSKNSYKDILVSNAGNGTFWHLTATTENLLESIDTYIDTNPVDVLNYTDVVHFNATFKKKLAQDNGVINLSIYSPAIINDKLNFTLVNSTFNPNSEIYLGKWDLSETINDYGEFRVQAFWINGTAAGFIEKTLTVIAQTDLTLITPNQEATFYSYETFNIIVYYEDINLNNAINGATINYNIDGQGWQSTSINNGTVGYYIISVNCNYFYSSGLKIVEIQVNKEFYENQTLSYNFNIIVENVPITPWWMVFLITLTYAVPIILALTIVILLVRKRRIG